MSSTVAPSSEQIDGDVGVWKPPELLLVVLFPPSAVGVTPRALPWLRRLMRPVDAASRLWRLELKYIMLTAGFMGPDSKRELLGNEACQDAAMGCSADSTRRTGDQIR